MGGGGRDKGGDAGEPGQGRVGQGEARRSEAKSTTSSGQGPSGQWGGWTGEGCAVEGVDGRCGRGSGWESGSEGAYVCKYVYVCVRYVGGGCKGMRRAEERERETETERAAVGDG